MRTCVAYLVAVLLAGVGVVFASPPGPSVAPGVDDCPPTNPPKVLLVVIGPQSGDTGPGGAITEAVAQRSSELAEEGYSPQKQQFPDMNSFLQWAESRASQSGYPDCLPRFRHVEIFAHGNAGGPLSGFGGPPSAQVEKWGRLGRALRKIMTHEAGEQGHIVFGWCSAGAPGVDEDKPEGKAPGGIVAGESGIPVYGPGGQILYPLDDDDGDPQTPSVPYPVGWPHSQPHPDRPSTPDTGNGDDGGWGRFPPEVPHPDDDEDGEPDQPGLIPNQGNDDPERLGPEDFDNDGKGKLPRAPGDPGKPAVPLTDESGDPLEHPETQEPLVDENGEPLQGPKGPHGGPVMDPASTNPGDPPLTGPIADPHQGKPFPSAPIGPPSSDQEPHVPPYVPPAGG